jgi:epoxide hydrolase-like predicted phosphatase
MAINTIVFDFGNVVGFFCHRQAAQQLAAYVRSEEPHQQALCVESIQYDAFTSSVARDYDSGQISTATFRDAIRKRHALTCDEDQFARAFADIFTPNLEVCALLPRLQTRYRLLLLSNTNDLHARHFGAQFREHLSHFSALVFSHEVGFCKPDPRIYQACQERAAVAAQECLFLDDLPANIEAAREHGWKTLVYQPNGTLTERLTEAGIVLDL